MPVQFPLSMLPNTRIRERRWRAYDRDRECKIQKMHFRTKLLTEYVENELPKHGFSLGTRIRAGSPRQRLYESTYTGKPLSFLIVPAANQWVHVSPLLEATVDHAVVVTFDRPIDDLAGAHDHPTQIEVFSIDGKHMTKMATSVLATGEHRRSEHVALPLFDSVIDRQPGNHQCSQGSLERRARLLWTEQIDWVRTSQDLVGQGTGSDLDGIVAALTRSGQRLRIECGGASMVVDPSQATFALV